MTSGKWFAPMTSLPGQRHQLACLIAGFVAYERGMSPHAIDLLVIRSEQMTLEQGWNPPPAGDLSAQRP
jgi:hypothetical protein